jgi:hypothetical protein
MERALPGDGSCDHEAAGEGSGSEEGEAMTIKRLILTIMPDFCWMTWQDVFLMAEQVDPELNESSFRTIFFELAKEGIFLTKPLSKRHLIARGGKPRLFMHPQRRRAAA